MPPNYYSCTNYCSHINSYHYKLYFRNKLCYESNNNGRMQLRMDW